MNLPKAIIYYNKWLLTPNGQLSHRFILHIQNILKIHPPSIRMDYFEELLSYEIKRALSFSFYSYLFPLYQSKSFQSVDTKYILNLFTGFEYTKFIQNWIKEIEHHLLQTYSYLSPQDLIGELLVYMQTYLNKKN